MARVNEGSHSLTCHPHVYPLLEPSRTERIQALADILRSPLCRHVNATRAPIANPPNSAQPGGTPTIPPGPCSSVGMRRGTDRQTDRPTDARDHYTYSVVYDSREM